MNKRNAIVTIAGIIMAIAYIAGTAYLLAMNQGEDIWGAILLPEAVIAIIFHIVALIKVKRGTLTVYRNWADFGISCIWPISILASIVSCFMMAMSEESIVRTICLVFAIVFAVASVVSLIWMFVGAFNNNKGKLFGGLIALSARTTASMLFLTWLSKLFEVKDNYNNSNVSTGDFVKSVVGFIVLGIWFKMLVVPLVADNRTEE